MSTSSGPFSNSQDRRYFAIFNSLKNLLHILQPGGGGGESITDRNSHGAHEALLYSLWVEYSRTDRKLIGILMGPTKWGKWGQLLILDS